MEVILEVTLYRTVTFLPGKMVESFATVCVEVCEMSENYDIKLVGVKSNTSVVLCEIL